MTARIRTAALIGLFALGVAVRLGGLDRAVWVDEAWVIESVREPTLRGMFYFSGWAQTTPPGVLVTLRALDTRSAQGPEAYRLAPLLCSLLALAVMLRLSSRLLAFPAALLAGLFAAASPYIAWYSVEIKQFPFDYCASALMLACGVAFSLDPSRRRLFAWTAVYGVVAWFSYTALFWLPALLTVPLCFHRTTTGTATAPPRLAEITTAFFAAASLSLLIYFVFGAPNRLDVLHEYWSQGFPDSTAFSAAYYLRHSIGQVLRSVVLQSPTPSTVAVLGALAIVGVWALARRADPDTGGRRAIIVLFTTAPLALAVANLAGLYPVGHFRLLYFLVPSALVALAAGIDALTGWLPTGGNPHRAGMRRTLAGCGFTLAAALFIGYNTVADRQRMNAWIPKMNARAITRYLHVIDSNAVPLYVDAINRPMFDVYRSEFPVTETDVVYGVHNPPCCIPGVPWIARTFSRDEIAREIEAMLATFSPGPFHAMLHVPSRDALASLELHLSVLEQLGCRVPWQMTDTEISLFRIACNRRTP